ncbi:MAG: hypothetical protein HYX92_04430 [Chloroflexi bacterium]|nr:hypothetical protein [Chloroflexota bacterium]
MFLTGSDLTPIEENVDKVIYALTKWAPKTGRRSESPAAAKVSISGKDCLEALDNMQLTFASRGWGDGLPLLPATEERVSRILTGSALPRDAVVGEGRILPRGGVCTVEALAIALAMAGGRPEYMPVLIAAMEAITNPLMLHHNFQATTNSGYPAVIVNGPAAKQIRLNSGYGCLGPDPTCPAGAAIGRAIRLLLMNVGGARPGKGTMAIYGGPARYTNIVFAEDEEGLPPDWAPLSVERGFPRGADTVTVHPVASTVNILNRNGMASTAEGQLTNILLVAADNMATLNANYFSGPNYFEGAPGIMLIPRGVARDLSHLGWSKKKVKAFLWEKSKVPDSPALRGIMMGTITGKQIPPEAVQYPMPITARPENIIVVVAGGEQSGHNYWMQVGVAGRQPTSAAIRLPANWEELIEKAEEELGPLQEQLEDYEDLRSLREAREAEGDAPTIGIDELKKKLG